MQRVEARDSHLRCVRLRGIDSGRLAIGIRPKPVRSSYPFGCRHRRGRFGRRRFGSTTDNRALMARISSRSRSRRPSVSARTMGLTGSVAMAASKKVPRLRTNWVSHFIKVTEKACPSKIASEHGQAGNDRQPPRTRQRERRDARHPAGRSSPHLGNCHGSVHQVVRTPHANHCSRNRAIVGGGLPAFRRRHRRPSRPRSKSTPRSAGTVTSPI